MFPHLEKQYGQVGEGYKKDLQIANNFTRRIESERRIFPHLRLCAFNTLRTPGLAIVCCQQIRPKEYNNSNSNSWA